MLPLLPSYLVDSNQLSIYQLNADDRLLITDGWPNRPTTNLLSQEPLSLVRGGQQEPEL